MFRKKRSTSSLTFILVVVLSFLILIGCEDEYNVKVEVRTTEQILVELAESLPGKVGEGEIVSNVKLADNILKVVIDFSNAESEYTSLEELAVMRASGITDRILEYQDLDDSWDMVIVDFGDIGKVVCDKSMILEEDVIGRYFDITEDYLE